LGVCCGLRGYGVFYRALTIFAFDQDLPRGFWMGVCQSLDMVRLL
jgi:hypothetical protein